MTALPERWAWLAKEPGPKILKEALKLYGVYEFAGDADNPQILAWAREVGGDAGWYNKDSIPWCGLFMAVVAKRAGKPVPDQSLRARAWLNWGERTDRPELGDVLVFWRGHPDSASGHVGIYVGETPHYYYVLGGNQSDKVCISRLEKVRNGVPRLLGSFAHWNIRKPGNVRPIFVGADFGKISENEA